MTREVQTARRYQPLYDLVEAFPTGAAPHAGGGGEQLVGIITSPTWWRPHHPGPETRTDERGGDPGVVVARGQERGRARHALFSQTCTDGANA